MGLLFSRVKVWSSGQTLTASDLDGEFDNILNNTDASTVKGISANVSAMQATANPGNVGSESLAANVLGEIQRIRYQLKAIAGNIQWYSPITGSLTVGGIGTTNIANLGVTTAKLADASVTQAKLAAPTYAISSSTGSFSTTSTSQVDITNATAAIVSTGRPAEIFLVNAAAGFGVVSLNDPSALSTLSCTIAMFRNGSQLWTTGIADNSSNLVGGIVLPCSTIKFWDDAPPAGTNTYKLQVSVNNASNTFSCLSARLVVKEV